MTKEQAIKLLSKDTSANEMHKLALEGLKQGEIIDKLQEAMDMGIKALEKQTAKEIHIYANGEEHCPCCDANLTGMNFKHCVECGQRIEVK